MTMHFATATRQIVMTEQQSSSSCIRKLTTLSYTDSNVGKDCKFKEYNLDEPCDIEVLTPVMIKYLVLWDWSSVCW